MLDDGFVGWLARQNCWSQADAQGVIRFCAWVADILHDEQLWQGLSALQAERARIQLEEAYRTFDPGQRAVELGAGAEARALVARLRSLPEWMEQREKFYLQERAERARLEEEKAEE